MDPYRLIVENVRDYLLLLLDREGRITSWNPGASLITGYREEEAVGQHVSLFYPPEDRATKPGLELATATKRGRFEEEAWRVRKDGSRFWANVVLTPVHDDHGAIIGFAKVTRDLTERVRAEQERAEHRRAISRLSMPVIRLWHGILLVPIVGDLEEGRSEDLMELVLKRVVEEQARILIVDVSGVPAMSTHVADALMKTTAALRLLGAQTVLTGISAQASGTMVRLGVDLRGTITQSHLAAGVEVALSILGKHVAEAPH